MNEHRRRQIDSARQLLGDQQAAQEALLDVIDGPIEHALGLLLEMPEAPPHYVYLTATHAVGLLALARQEFGTDGWQRLRERQRQHTLQALDQLDQLD